MGGKGPGASGRLQRSRSNPVRVSRNTINGRVRTKNPNTIKARVGKKGM